MDALILSCGTGGGHNAAGFAVKEELLRRGHRVTMMNPYDLCGDKLAAIIDKAYIKLAQHAPKAFGAIYVLGNLYRRLPWRSPVYFVNAGAVNTLAAFLQEHPVDVVIMPHIFPAEILTYMREHGMPVPKTIFIATDYTCIPFTEECCCDACIIPSSKLMGEFISRGIPAERIHPFGIPVRGCFGAPPAKEEAKRTLKLDASKKYILISGGSIGAGKVKKTLALLYEITQGTPYRLIVICGSNARLRQDLTAQYGKSVLLLGQTEHMPLYLRACDLYLTKPGGLSTTEAAVMEVPLVLLPPIPGCETRNLQFYTQNGMAVEAELSQEGLRRMLDLLDAPSACEEMLHNQRTVIPKDAAPKICRLAEEMTAGK